jgi:hypothetical protein
VDAALGHGVGFFVVEDNGLVSLPPLHPVVLGLEFRDAVGAQEPAVFVTGDAGVQMFTVDGGSAFLAYTGYFFFLVSHRGGSERQVRS